jgi:hypothetical protein
MIIMMALKRCNSGGKYAQPLGRAADQNMILDQPTTSPVPARVAAPAE